MSSPVIEAQYPIGFREDFASQLGLHLRNRHSLVLVGMRRIGISNFLRFFLYHPGISKTYIKDSQPHLFVPVDLNDLVELELFPFWILTLKRIVDAAEHSLLKGSDQKVLQTIFLDCIQSQDLFLTIDGIKKSLLKIIEAGLLPDIFFIRFDRLTKSFTPEFLANLESLKEATHHKLSIIFTAFRPLSVISPEVFGHASLSLIDDQLYLKLAQERDMQIVLDSTVKKYRLKLNTSVKPSLLELAGGYIQYLQLALIILHQEGVLPSSQQQLYTLLTENERIKLQSEELWESLTPSEQETLLKLESSSKVTKQDKQNSNYLWETGLISENGKVRIFSPIFENFLQDRLQEHDSGVTNVDFSKKEYSLFKFLEENLNQICEREAIIEAVWPEEEALGVSDWAIDRLIARVRNKLKQQGSGYELVTVKTRGFKLVAK